ncbi:MAG TPA: hypothetical protein EYO33_23920 [Phycisphaerales bacterium]|nr:hypothetical protein [Phycisphaerales bacterium]
MGDPCRSFEELLFEPDEELCEKNQIRLAEHIQKCEACREERELFLESWSALGDLEEEAELLPSPMIRAKVWEQIREDELKPVPLIEETTVVSLQGQLMKLAVASVALLLGFGLGRGVRPEAPPPTLSQTKVASQSGKSQDFIDPALIKLASQDGFSMEIFPESNQFTPLDKDTLSTLAPTEEERRWVTRSRGAVVPVQYISRSSRTR